MMFSGSKGTEPHAGKTRQILTGERVAILYARIALGAAFLSAVADRFGLWGRYGGWGNFANFEKYTAQVNSFMPAFIVPFLAWTATAAELSLGIALIIGVWTRWVAFGSSALLLLFGTAMALSFGLKSPLDYSVFRVRRSALTFFLQRQGPISYSGTCVVIPAGSTGDIIIAIP